MITTFVALLSITVGLIEDIVGLVSATVLKDNTPDPFVVSACPFVPSVAGKVKKTPVFNFVELWLIKLPMFACDEH